MSCERVRAGGPRGGLRTVAGLGGLLLLLAACTPPEEREDRERRQGLALSAGVEGRWGGLALEFRNPGPSAAGLHLPPRLFHAEARFGTTRTHLTVEAPPAASLRPHAHSRPGRPAGERAPARVPVP